MSPTRSRLNSPRSRHLIRRCEDADLPGLLLKPPGEVVQEPRLLRESPGGSIAFSRNWSRRCVFVKVPSFSDVSRRRQQEYFGLNIFRPDLAAFHLGRVVPERCGLDLHHVPHYQPFQLGQRAPLEARVRAGNRRVVPHDKETFHLAFRHLHPIRHVGVITGQPGQPPESVVVLRGCGITVVSLEEANDVLIEVRPADRFSPRASQ